ncbi:MAG: hypothetical protein HYY04_05815 [Chloroflexi bacterium]|nr:hypothetical protein [Chloroflexota bacterium]
MVPFDPKRYGSDEPPPFGGRANSRPYTTFQVMFLTRLNRLLRERQEWSRRSVDHPEQAPQAPDWRVRLLAKAIYSTFRDCVDLGVGAEARSLMDQKSTSQSAPFSAQRPAQNSD